MKIKTYEKIEQWLLEHDIYDYHIRDDLSVDVDNDVDLSEKELEEIPIQFNNIIGSFNISNNYLNSLIGSPRRVSDSFIAFSNYLENLKYFPKIVGQNIHLEDNELKILEYLPKIIRGNLSAENNKIIAFLNPPKLINGLLNLKNNNIISLKSFPIINGDIILNENPLNFKIDEINENIKGLLLLDKEIPIFKNFSQEETSDEKIMISISQLKSLLLKENLDKKLTISKRKITRKI